MKDNEKNFACVEKCGYININTMAVQKAPIDNSNKLQFNKHKRKKHAKGDPEQKNNDNNFESSTYKSLKQETSEEFQFIEEQPFINWKSREFKFNNTVNQRNASAIQRASEPFINNNNGIPIARLGHTVNIDDDINNNFLEDMTKVESTTKLQCRNIIKNDDYCDDISGNVYYNDDDDDDI